jgi:hypothetical protein
MCLNINNFNKSIYYCRKNKAVKKNEVEIEPLVTSTQELSLKTKQEPVPGPIILNLN